MKKGRAGTMTDDYKWNGTTTLPEDAMGKGMAPFRFGQVRSSGGDRGKGGSGSTPVRRRWNLASEFEYQPLSRSRRKGVLFGGERLPPELDRCWSSYPLLRGHCPATPRAAAAIAPARRTRREWEERVRRNAQAASISHDEKHCGAATPRSCRRGSFTRRARRQRPVLFCPEARTKRAAGTFGLTSRDGGSAGRRDRGGRSH
jgi:hypothetical protein